MRANEWQDTDVDDRQPQFCCYCGSEDGFDGLDVRGDHCRVKCGECGHEFITVSPSAEVSG
jgi:hypothetical protein